MPLTPLSEDLHGAHTLRNGGASVCCAPWLQAGFALAIMLGCFANVSAQSSENATPLPQRNPASTPYDIGRSTTSQDHEPSAQDGDNSTLPLPIDSTRLSALKNVDVPGALTTAQVFNVLQQKPEAIVELKSMLAMEMQQQ